MSRRTPKRWWESLKTTDQVAAFSGEDVVSRKIAGHVIRFLLEEKKAGRIPGQFFSFQAGVGNTANAVLAGQKVLWRSL